MNKQELIEKLKSDLTAMSEFEGSKYEYGKGYRCATNQHLEMLSDLDESEKPVVPQFVANMIVKRKRASQSIIKAIENLRFYEDACKWVRNNGEAFVKAWLFGYEVEKEKLYTVEIPNPNAEERPILFKKRDGNVQIIFPSVPCWRVVKNAQLTEAEIKQDFEWAWQFAKEVEE